MPDEPSLCHVTNRNHAYQRGPNREYEKKKALLAGLPQEVVSLLGKGVIVIARDNKRLVEEHLFRFDLRDSMRDPVLL